MTHLVHIHFFTDHAAALGNMEHIGNENRTQIRQLEIQAHRAVQNFNELAQHSKSHPRPASVCLKIPTFQNSSGLITLIGLFSYQNFKLK